MLESVSTVITIEEVSFDEICTAVVGSVFVGSGVTGAEKPGSVNLLKSAIESFDMEICGRSTKEGGLTHHHQSPYRMEELLV